MSQQHLLKYFEKQLNQYLLLFYTIACVVGFLGNIGRKWLGLMYTTYDWGRLLSSYVVVYFSKFVFIYLSVLFTIYLIRKQTSIIMGIVFHIMLSVLFSFYYGLSQRWYDSFVFGEIYSSSIWDDMIARVFFSLDFNFFIYFSMIGIVYAYYYFKTKRGYEIKEVQLTNQLLDSKISALQSQLQPHFLFNTLNDITALVKIDAAKAEEAITDLSDMLRETLALSDSKFISLEKELFLAKRYIKLEKIRYGEKLNFSITVDGDQTKILILPLLLQPLIENAIKHGFSYAHDAIGITISIVNDNKHTTVRILNSGKPLLNDEVEFGIGLSNIVSRLHTVFDENFTFYVKNSTDHVEAFLQYPVTMIDEK